MPTPEHAHTPDLRTFILDTRDAACVGGYARCAVCDRQEYIRLTWDGNWQYTPDEESEESPCGAT